MHALAEGGADVRAVDEQGFSALLNAVKVGSSCAHLCSFSGMFEYKHVLLFLTQALPSSSRMELKYCVSHRF